MSKRNQQDKQPPASPTTSMFPPSSRKPVTPDSPDTYSAQCAPEKPKELFTSVTSVFTKEGMLRLEKKEPSSRESVLFHAEEIRFNGLIVSVPGGLKKTIYMPHYINKVIVELIPYKEEPDQNK